MKPRPILPALVAAIVCLAHPAKAQPQSVRIDATKTGAPINPHIYGQFIEHLGRCIYGGIWAEMLEDRKFYFPVQANYAPYGRQQGTEFPVVSASPWQIVGPPDSVTMVKVGAFVGRHAPRVAAGSGVRQRDLGVRAGVRCDGYLWVKPLSGTAEIEVTLRWGEGPDAQASTRLTYSGGDYTRHTFSLTPGATTEKGAVFEIRVLRGEVLLGPPSLMPADNVRGLRRDTLALLKQLNGTVYRWPGGNFVSGYDWRDGIGDRDRRPPRKNPAWTGVEHNDFGTDEFVAFCREIGAEPMIAVNTGFGDPHSAAQWVEYCNSAASSLAGGWRARHGQADPYGVKYWCVGNEMWGSFQLGFMQLHHYTIKHNLTAEAMWQVDPKLALVGVGDLETINRQHDPEMTKRGLTWSRGMLEACADHMTMLSEHFYAGRLPWTQDQRTDLLTHVGQLRESIRKKAEGHRRLQPSLPNLKGRIVPIAMDEWNYWHREYAYGELGCVYELADGLGVAAGLHEFFRHSDIIHMAHYAQTVNVIGAIKTTRTTAEMESTGLVLQMYRAHYGDIPLQVSAPPAPFDVAAALTKDARTLTIGAVNPTDAPLQLRIDLQGAKVGATGTRWHVTGASATTHNTPGKPRQIDIRQTDDVATTSALTVPPLSAAVFRIPLNQ